jgi:hypothetical protein
MSQSTENATSNLTEEEQILADVKNEAEQLKTQTLETDVSLMLKARLLIIQHLKRMTM